MPNFKSFTTLSLVTFACLALYANTPSDDLIIEKENKTIEAILKADDAIGTRSNKSLDKETLSAMLCIVSNFILNEAKEVVDQPTVFNLTTFDGPPGTKGLDGTITDDDGITSVKIEYSNGSVSNYTDGEIDSEGVANIGTTYTITVTDDNGVVKTKMGTL
jgi:hypothetical protein